MNQSLRFTAAVRSVLLSAFLLPLVPSSFLMSQADAQGIVFNSVSPVQSTVAKWDKFEATISLTANYSNPYNYSDIDVQAVFTSPTGVQHTVDAFWMQDYSIDAGGNLTSVGSPGFHIRFTPDETGQWSYVLNGYLNWNAAGSSSTQFFTCSGTSAVGKGYIRKANSRYLKWDNGDQYIPLGENLAYPTSSLMPYYDGYLKKLKNIGANHIRVWMATWSFALEWTGANDGFNGLEQYKQTAAKELDSLLDRGLTDGYALMLTINYHNQFKPDGQGPEWAANPYNSANGGPCTSPDVFFTDENAKNILKNRLRYMMARWGYAGTLESWELFNEVDNLDNYQDNLPYIATIDQWHDEMAAYIHSIDPNHLVTTSFGADTAGKGTWASTHIDFTQTHRYTTDNRLPRILANFDRQRVDSFGKPSINGEFGLSTGGDIEPSQDASGITLHNCLWATLLSGGMGSAAPYWWDSWIEADNLYKHFSAPAVFRDIVPFVAGNDHPVKAAYMNTGPADLTVVPVQQWPVDSIHQPAVFDFTLDNEGELTPDISKLNFFVFGMAANQQNRRPPTFHVTYLRDGTFVVNTDSTTIGTNPRIDIYVDGTLVLDQPALLGYSYRVSITAGAHTIKVDNTGSDWFMVSNYQFLNAVGPLHLYTLQGAGGTQTAGYVLDRQYTYQYVNSNGAPAVVPAGAIVNMPNMQNGAYTLNYYTTAATDSKPSAIPIETRMATAVNGTLTFTLPAISWDAAFTATPGSAPSSITTTVTATPGAGWGTPPAANFVVTDDGVTPGAGSLGMFVYGSLTNLQYRNPPTFVVNYAQAGSFQVTTAASISQGFPHVTVFLDGVNVFDQAAAVSTTYTVSIPAGLHSIMVDNLGGDWVQVDHYTFAPANGLARIIPADSATSVAFYPNPNRGLGHLDINSPHGGPVTVYMQDINRNTVYQASEQLSGAGKTSLMLNLKALASGIYIVNVRFNTGEVISKKVVIVK